MPVEAPANRVVSIEELFHKGLVHDRDAAFLLVFIVAKIAAAQWNTHDIEISGAAFDRDRDRQ